MLLYAPSMRSNPVHLAQLAIVLRDMGRANPDINPVIRIARDDPRFDWNALCGCSNGGFPGLDVGQHRDCRYRTGRIDGVHVHEFFDRIEVHLDRVDPLNDPLGHMFTDTAILEGALAGAGIGVLLAMLTNEPKFIGLGAGLGAMAGVSQAARPPHFVTLAELLA